MKDSIFQFATLEDRSVSLTQIKRSSLPPEGPLGDKGEFIKEYPPVIRLLRNLNEEDYHSRLISQAIDVMVVERTDKVALTHANNC